MTNEELKNAIQQIKELQNHTDLQIQSLYDLFEQSKKEFEEMKNFRNEFFKCRNTNNNLN